MPSIIVTFCACLVAIPRRPDLSLEGNLRRSVLGERGREAGIEKSRGTGH